MTHNATKAPRRQASEGQGHFDARMRKGAAASNPRANYERYIALARESVSVGDAVETENWLQHAEHYYRMMRDPAS